jgi:hypothetical protein
VVDGTVVGGSGVKALRKIYLNTAIPSLLSISFTIIYNFWFFLVFLTSWG